MPILILVLTVIAVVTIRFSTHMRTLRAGNHPRLVEISSSGYGPMLRLLADDDLDFAGADVAALTKLRTRRRRIFREYLHRLSEDYGQLLAGIRLMMVQSGVDRPDLARALLKNRVLFAAALCRIDIRLALHALGIGSVDASKLVEAFYVLHSRLHVPNSATSV